MRELVFRYEKETKRSNSEQTPGYELDLVFDAGSSSFLAEIVAVTERVGNSAIAPNLCYHRHMRISVPGVPQAILNAQPVFAVNDIAEALDRLSSFLRAGKVAVLTGAGVSVDSGLRAYRGEDGRYMNPNYK